MVRNQAFVDNDGENSQKNIDEVSSIKVTSTDGAQLTKVANKISELNINDYATRKTIAQGMLDLALLTANAAQLRRVLIFGPENRFYYFLVTLISISLILQVFQAILMCILAIVFDLNKVDEHRRTNVTNNILLMTTVISVSVNILISTFDLADIK